MCQRHFSLPLSPSVPEAGREHGCPPARYHVHSSRSPTEIYTCPSACVLAVLEWDSKCLGGSEAWYPSPCVESRQPRRGTVTGQGCAALGPPAVRTWAGGLAPATPGLSGSPASAGQRPPTPWLCYFSASRGRRSPAAWPPVAVGVSCL